MPSIIAIAILGLLTRSDPTISLEMEREDDRCEIMMKKIVNEDRTIITDNTPYRLHSTWLSQQCEIRAGSNYIIRKYSFFENGTFLLLRYHYAEESCSIATYTVVARGTIKILSPSITVPGATEANVQLSSVHLMPLNRQIAHKFGRKMNSSCGGVESKWRSYVAQLIYEHSDFPSTMSDYELNSNSLQSRLLRPRRRDTLDCLESFGIEFTELRLLRVETKGSAINSSDREDRGRVELLLGEPTRNVRSKSSPNRLQSTALLRADTALDCPICGSVFRATESSPPLFHQTPSFPAVIGGRWSSVRCESVEGGFWSKRFFRIYSENDRWIARWTYYTDPICMNPLYMVTAAGNYIQRAFGQKQDLRRLFRTRNSEQSSRKTFSNRVISDRSKKNLEMDRSIISSLTGKGVALPSGVTELELQIVESLSIPIGNAASTLCNRIISRGTKRTKSWKSSKNCIPQTVKAPATLLFKARVSMDWNGDYMLLLASSKDDHWNSPLRRCSGAAGDYFRTGNSLRGSLHFYHLQFSAARSQYKRRWFSSSFTSYFSASSALLAHPTLLLLLYCSLIFIME